jgi:hypothetical protein
MAVTGVQVSRNVELMKDSVKRISPDPYTVQAI